MAHIDLPLELCSVSTTFHCCGTDLTITLDYESACHYLRCPTCHNYLNGKQKSSVGIWSADTN